jgi:hypothetical protein
LPVVSWLLRALLGVGGALLVYAAAPYVWGAWQVLGVSTTVNLVRERKPITDAAALAATGALDRAVRADDRAQHHLDRAELLAALALTLQGITDSQRGEWLRAAEADVEIGLARRPGYGIGWLRLASVRHAIGGPSKRVAAPLLMSIDTAPVIPRLWPARLELILRNLEWFSEDETKRLEAYVAMTWQASPDRRWFIEAMREPFDELFIRMLLGDQPAVQDELTTWKGLVGR